MSLQRTLAIMTIYGNVLTLYGNVPILTPQIPLFYRCVPTFGFGRLATMGMNQVYGTAEVWDRGHEPTAEVWGVMNLQQRCGGS